MRHTKDDQEYGWYFVSDQRNEKGSGQEEKAVDQVEVLHQPELPIAHEKEVMGSHKRESLIRALGHIPQKKAKQKESDQNHQRSHDLGSNV